MPDNKKIWFSVIGLLVVFYVAFRFWHLTDSCLWFDEVFSLHAAEHSWRLLPGFILEDLIHPPLFYVLLKVWISFGGESLFFVRLFSVLISIVALIPFYFLCRQIRLSNPAIALALSFFSVNGYLIKYAQEVRMYSLLLCLSLFSLWLFARFLNVGKGIWFLTIVNILLVYTQYFGWFIVVGEVLTVLYLQRIKIGQTMLMAGVTAISFVPWVIAVLGSRPSQSALSQNLGWASRPSPFEILRFIFNLNEPFYFQASNISAVSNFIVSLPIGLCILTALIACAGGWKKRSKRERSGMVFLIIIISAPVLLGFIFSWILPFSVWGTRHLIIIYAPYAIFVARAFDLLPARRLKVLLAAGVLILIILAFGLHVKRGTEAYIWCGWENLAAQIPPAGDEPVRVFVFEDETAYLMWFAVRERSDVRIIKVNGMNDIPEDSAYFLPRGFDLVSIAEPQAMTGDGFYIAFRAKEFNYLRQPLSGLIANGYRIGEPVVFEAQGLRAYLVEIKR